MNWKSHAPVFALFVSALAPNASAEGIDFNREVRPILSQNCFACHGPDAHDRKAGLRLDEREAAVELRDGVRAIDVERPEESEVLLRIFSEDADDVMPPPKSHKTLSASDKAILKQWIEEGAPYADHWAFVPVERPALPEVEKTYADWTHNVIDRFVLERLQAEGMKPSSAADRATWFRRVTFDLTGLPPAPADVADQVASTHPNADERALDRLLASPRYGERMAVAWMDAARYGDSSVMHADGNRDMWPWRDWLIDAYNTNKPFDDFTVEQLAGDLLPDPTVEQQIASGFNRNHATSDEGGAIPEELRVEYVVDRVKTTANVWLALSMECGQCHDHKYDPISQQDYYAFFAYFNNTTDPGMQTRNGNQAPLVRIFSEAQESQLAAVRKEIQTVETQLKEENPPEEEVDAWARKVLDGARQEPPVLGAWSSIGPFKGKAYEEAWKHDFGLEKEKTRRGRKAYGGLKWSKAKPEWKDNTVHVLAQGDGEVTYLGREIETEKETKGSLMLGSDDAIKVWLDGKLIHENKAQRGAARDQDQVEVTLKPGKHWLLVKVVNASGPSGFAFRWASQAYPEKVLELVKREAQESVEAQRKELISHYKGLAWPRGRELERHLRQAKDSEKALVNAAPTSMIMEDRPKEPRMTYILDRGQYDQPKKDQAISPDVPAALPRLPDSYPQNRLGLAQWLTMPEHPLTARVAVNRYWAMLFGTGIVKTVGDFGNQGEWPSHPELLDWLARDFVDFDWDVKWLVRQLLSSATYGQSSAHDTNTAESDPENRLLSRAPRFRLQGEFIRDQALAVSGLLVEQQGGPGVKPYQPENIWNEVSLNGGLRYRRDDGDKLYRRSLYTYWKRSAPMPNMVIFDSPSREKCALERPRTNTPLQALVTLNDPQFVEAARLLAERLLEDERSAQDRISRGYQLVTGRPATDEEARSLGAWIAEQEQLFKKAPERAQELLKVGDYPASDEHAPETLASWTLLAQLLLNLDETLTRN